MEPGEFRGVIGRDFSESTAWWPETVRAPDGAPNIVFIVVDDVGFAQIGCFGSDIDTPVLDGLAARGLRYTNFHTTALCSPTRSCLMTGRNHHVNGMGRVIELATGFPGYDARIPRANGFLSEMLVPQGYATFAVGKWHLTPEDECHSAAPRHRWPLSRGFERFYGFFTGETHQFVPALVSDSHQVLPPRSPDEGYHLTEDLVDHAIEHVGDLKAADPGKPFFMYFCTGACHAPHQAPPEWIERYRGAFDSGWDAWRDATLARQIEAGVLPERTELSPRPEWVPPWDSLSAPERKLYARYMEAFAGFLSHTDHHVGRLVSFLDDIGDLDNTIIFVLSDNGASSEGGPTGSVNDGRMWNLAPREVDEALERIDELGGPYCHNNYPWGWTIAGNTPFRRWKREVHEGGVADPLIVHWPAGIADPGGFRRQYVHAIDLLPTVLEVLRVEAPEVLNNVQQRPLDGISFSDTFEDPGVPGRHETQYYEMFGCRAIYHRGWKAVTFHPIQDTRKGFDEDQWELYNMDEDPSEVHDLARQHPAKLEELIERWWTEAGRNQVLPLDNRPFSQLVFNRPCEVPAVSHYVCRPGAAPVPEAVAVSVRNRSHQITAEVEVSSTAAEGVIVAQGSGLGGWSFYVADRRLAYVHNYVSLEEQHVRSDVELSPGRHLLGFHFDRTANNEGTARLLIDGEVVGEGPIPKFTPARFSLTGAGLTCGYSDGLPVTREYRAPFRFTGRIIRAVIDVDGPAFMDREAEARAAIARQ